MTDLLSNAEYVNQTVTAIREELAKRAPHALEQVSADQPDPETEVEILLDALVREAPEIAEQWRVSESCAADDSEMTPEEVGQSQYLTAAIDRAVERAAKAKGEPTV